MLCFQILYNFHNVCSLVACEEYQGKSVFDSKMHIRNKTSHLFVVKIPKLVISIKDNEEKQNCSKQQYCNK